MRPLSLTLRLALMFGFFAVTLLAVFGLFVDNVVSQRLVQAQERQLQQAADQMSARLDQDMLFHFREIAMASTSMVLTSDRSAADKRAFLDRIKQRLPTYAWIGLTNSDGVVVADTDGLLTGTNVSVRNWFGAGREGPAVLDVHQATLLQRLLAPNSATKLRFVDLVAPVYDEHHRFAGVLAGHLHWTWAEDLRTSILSTVATLPGVDLLVVSHNGETILGPAERVGQSYDLAGISARLRRPDQLDFFRESGHVTALAATTGLGDYRGLGWSVVAQMPIEAALAPVREVRLVMLVGSAIIAAIFVLLGVTISAFVSRPLRRLARAATRMQTDPGATMPRVGGYREAALLADALRRATAALRGQKEELRLLNDDLETQVASRTVELRAAKTVAEAATAAKAEFLATMSHEVRTPVSSIIGFADLLLADDRLDSVQRRRLKSIQSSGSLLIAIINDVLDFSKIEAGKIEVVSQPFEVGALIEACETLIAPAAEANGLILEASIDVEHRTFLGDQLRLRQVMLNLLSNAVKFTRCGRVSIGVSQAGSEGGTAMVTFSVEDTGIGIAPDKLGRVFERFSQADTSIEREFGGTGLGLAISQRLVGLMGGTISVRSRVGRGSLFSFTIPLAPAQPTPIADAPDAAGPERALRILLAEDVPANREIISCMLSRSGHDVEAVGDGTAAVAAAGARTFDAILMDVHMPGMTGVEAARAIRALGGHNAEVPILALTANVLPRHVAAYEAAGLSGHIGKPVSRAGLLARIDALVGAQARPEAAAACDDPALDRAVHADIKALLGPARIGSFLGDLADQLTQFPLVGFAPGDLGALGEAAHRLAGLAGMLGLAHLAALCRRLDDVCDTSADAATPRSELIALIPKSLGLIAELRTAAEDEAEPMREFRHVA